MGSSSEHKTDPRDSGSIRTFICIEIPDSIKERIARLQQTLPQQNAKISWVKSSNIHLTVKFLGDVAATRIQTLCSAVERAAGVSRAFEIEVGGAGCFPSKRNPRIFWVGLTGVLPVFAQLHGLIDEELAREGFPRDARKFSPHLTIGRVRSPENASLVAEALITTGFEPESFQAREVIVMRSDLNPAGSIYSPLLRQPLGAET
jgi:2'-5' RNA ligase